MRFEQYLLTEEISYEVYCSILKDDISESLLSSIKDKINSYLKMLSPIKDIIKQLSNDLKIGLGEVVKAFTERNMFNFLKAIRFNLSALLRALKALSSFVRNGLFKIFEEIAKNKYIQKIRQGVMKIDELLDKYPLLKKVAGIAVAGLLIYMWLNMTFIGDFDYDFNLLDVVNALSGSYVLADLFVSPNGLMLVALFASGGLISFPWLGKSVYNIMIALCYSGYKMVKDNPDNAVVRRLKSAIGK